MTDAPKTLAPGDHVFLVDGSNFIFRAFFQSIRQDRKYNYRADQLPTGAVRLFCAKLLQFVRDGAAGVHPTHLAIIFDKSENSFRKEIYPAYKANRAEPPEDLVPQFPLFRAAVRSFGLEPVEQDVYEADDLIATYAKQAKEAGADVTIISADKDLMQLVRPGVAMYDPASGEREERKIGREEVIAYFGAPPEKVVDIQALAGDSTDNVPGAPGIGVKTAAQLIHEYGDLDTLIARAGEIKQNKRRETLTDPEVIEKVRLSKRLVRLVDDVKVTTPLDDLRLQQPDGKALVAFLKAMEFTTITRRVGEIFDVDVSAVDPDPAFVGANGWRGRNGEIAAPKAEQPEMAPAPRGKNAALTPAAFATTRAEKAMATPVEREKYVCISSAEELESWISQAFDAGFVCFDTETDSLDPMQANLVGVSLALAPNRACYIPLGHR
ncbi:5'-3' exonuclease H3TH domain-containing protein, partial [Rhodoblastus sp.]